MKSLAALLFAFLALRTGAALPFPQAGSDLRPDPTAHFGVLPNGLRYVVRANSEPKGRASLRLLVLSGSLEEREDQRGLAHFLEHMAFNGSTHYPPGTLVEYFQRLGMSFGGDTNAYTSFDHTAYKIELPNAQPATVAEGLRVFADMAGGLLLKPEMIAKERPIILSEERTRDSVGYRQFVASLNFLLAGSRLTERLPIGLEPVINSAQRDRFVDLYDTWYRPDRMAVIVVGDIDPAAVAGQITAAFSGLAARAPSRPNPNLGSVPAFTGLRVAYAAEANAPATTITLAAETPYAGEPDLRERRLRHLRRDLAVAMLNRRLEILAKKEGAPFIRAAASAQENFNFVHEAEIEIKCQPAQWAAAIAVGEQQLRQALTFGFSPAELAEARANLRNDLQQAAAAATTRRAEEISDEVVNSLVEKTVFMSPADELALYEPALARLTPEECTAALRLAFQAPGRNLIVAGNAAIPGDAEAAIRRAYQTAQAIPIAGPDAGSDTRFAYADWGAPGRVAAARHVEDLDLTLATLANGVRVNLKHTPFEANQIRVRLRVGGGRLTEPKAEPGLALLTDLTFEAGGLGRHSADDLQRILAGKTLGLEFAVKNDAFEFTATTNREDLVLQLQLLAAYLTDPGYRPESYRAARKQIEEFYNEIGHVVEGPLRASIPRALADGDPRFGLPERAVAESRTLAEERAWLAPQWAHGAIEIALVGDIDVDAALQAVAATFGTLPQRKPKPAYTAERQVHFPPPGAVPGDYAVASEIPKTAVALFWPTADARDIHRTRRLGLLADVFGDRLRIKLREQLGGAYNPQAASQPSDTFTDYGLLVSEVIVAPARAGEIAQSIRTIATNLQTQGVTADELERAKKPVLTALRDSANTNQYWIGAVLGSCQEFPQRLQWARTRESDIAAITTAELNALATAYLDPARAFQVIVHPSAKK